MNGRVNSYDVAREAGVNRSVVSLVVNGKADRYRISRATQEKVRAVIQRTGYTPDLYVRDLFMNRHGTDSVSTPAGTADPAKLKSILESALAGTGYQIQIAESPGQVSGLQSPNTFTLVLPSAGPPAAEENDELGTMSDEVKQTPVESVRQAHDRPIPAAPSNPAPALDQQVISQPVEQPAPPPVVIPLPDPAPAEVINSPPEVTEENDESETMNDEVKQTPVEPPAEEPVQAPEPSPQPLPFEPEVEPSAPIVVPEEIQTPVEPPVQNQASEPTESAPAATPEPACRELAEPATEPAPPQEAIQDPAPPPEG